MTSTEAEKTPETAPIEPSDTSLNLADPATNVLETNDPTKPEYGTSAAAGLNNVSGASNERKPVVKISDLAVDLLTTSFPRFIAKHGKNVTPKVACRIRDYLNDRGTESEKIPQELLDLAGQKRPGRVITGPMIAPNEGETRPYTVSQQGRIGLSVDIIGKKAGDTVYVTFSKDGLAVLPSQPGA